MSRYRDWCDNPREHRREGACDFERHGSYGYDRERYYNRDVDACDREYMRGFDDARHDEERRRERAEEEAAEQRRWERVERERRDEEREREWAEEQERAYYYAAQQQGAEGLQ